MSDQDNPPSENEPNDPRRPNKRIGYGNPPDEHKYKPGRSGNPKGRPKGAKGLRGVLETEQNSRIKVSEKGRTRSMSKLQVGMRRLVDDAAKGNPRAMKQLIDLNLRMLGPGEDEQKGTELTAAEEKFLQQLMRAGVRGDEEAGHHPTADHQESGAAGETDD